MHTNSAFVRLLLGNLRLSAIVCAIAIAALAIYSLFADEPIMWEIAVFLAVGMAVSSLVNAWADARRERRSVG